MIGKLAYRTGIAPTALVETALRFPKIFDWMAGQLNAEIAASEERERRQAEQERMAQARAAARPVR
jgi:hypothetical protein